MPHLLSYADKELTYSLVLATDWLCVIWFDKKRFRESHKITGKIPLLLQILDQMSSQMDSNAHGLYS